MIKKLFKKHNVVNIYIEKYKGEDIELKDAEDILESLSHLLYKSLRAGKVKQEDMYMYPYITKDSYYLKLGVRNSVSYSELLSIIKITNHCGLKLKYRTQKFLFKEVHYNIEAIKFTAFNMLCAMKQLEKDKKFVNCSSRDVSMGCDYRDKKSKQQILPEEWMHLLHHIFLGQYKDYVFETYINGMINNHMQLNINREKSRY